MNRKFRRQMLRTEKKELLKGIDSYKDQVNQDAFLLAKQLASKTITDVVIPSVELVLREGFLFSDDEIAKFNKLFSQKADELTTQKGVDEQ